MMAKISWLERRAGYSLLLLVVSGLSILPAAWCQYCNTVNGEPLIEISSTPPSNKLNIGATVNLTCTGRQPDDQMSVNTRPRRIEWFDPQDKRVNDCRAGSPPAARMNCKITVGVLTNETLGIYTCRARNGYNHCSTKKILLGLQAEVKETTVVPPATGTKAEVKESTVVPPVTGTEAETKWSTVVHPDTGAEGPSTTRKRENVEIIAITVSLSVAIMLLGGISVFLQYCRRRCVHNQAYNKENPQPSVTFNKTLQEENQPENIYDYIDSHPLSMPPQEHEEVPLSGHNPEENPLLGTLGVEGPIKRPPQARPLPPIPQIDDASQKMEENSEHKVTCSRMLQSESQNPNFQTPEEGSCTLDSTGSRGSILDGQDIALDIEKKTGLTAVSQDTDKEPGLLPSRGSISETEDETKPVFNTLRVDFSAGEPPKARELLPIPDFEDAPTRPPKPTKETKGGTKCNRNSSINSQEVEEDYEIDLKRLEVQDEVLGEGEFGIVHKGRYHCKDKKVIDVAVKQLKDTAGMTSKVALLSEVQMLKKAGRHPNIVNLVGACTHGDNILLVTDLIPGGTLESLLNSKPAPGEHSKYENVKCALNDRELIKIALQIASGMQHLERKKCIHGDLAARNVFIDENKVAKLGDFGMARDISDRGIYNKTSNGKVPWRWLSLESLRYLVYTSQSDVWSFGILLWEIATFGEVPYPDIATPWALISFLSSGRRMPRPDHCSEELYALMQSCWMENPLRRPTFDDITKRIKYLLRKVKKSYVNVQHDDITVDSEIL